MQPNAVQIAGFIDHTLLKPDATSSQIVKVCREAREFGFFGVCVNSLWVPLVAQSLKGSAHPRCVSVIGFPLGAMSTESKAAETTWCVDHGAEEIDMVLSIGLLKEKKNDLVEADIAAVVKAARGKIVKVILETALLTDDEKVLACQLSVHAGAHFVKTCTGFGGGAATVEDIRLMRKAVGPKVGVKASGGIKSLAQALSLIEAGATRLGTSSGVALVQGQAPQSGY